MPKLRIQQKFGITPNHLLNDPKITFKAKWLFWYLQSKPDDWDFSADRIKNDTKENRDAILSWLKELEKFWYLKRERYRDDKWQRCVEYILYDKPILEEKPTTENPHWINEWTSEENPTQENPTQENSTYNKEWFTNQEKEKKSVILSKDNIEQSSEISDLENLENWKNETQEKTSNDSDVSKNSSTPAVVEVVEEFWDKEINAILKLLCKAVWIDEFKESQARQRIYWRHFVNWIKKNGKQEFLDRLTWILSDGFKAKNANSIAYLYNEIKSFIHSPVVTPVDSNKKPITFW